VTHTVTGGHHDPEGAARHPDRRGDPVGRRVDPVDDAVGLPGGHPHRTLTERDAGVLARQGRGDGGHHPVGPRVDPQQRVLACDPDGTEADIDVGEGTVQPDPGGDDRASWYHGRADRGDRWLLGSAGKQPRRHADNQHGQGQTGDQDGPPPRLAAQPPLQPRPGVRLGLPPLRLLPQRPQLLLDVDWAHRSLTS